MPPFILNTLTNGDAGDEALDGLGLSMLSEHFSTKRARTMLHRDPRMTYRAGRCAPKICRQHQA